MWQAESTNREKEAEIKALREQVENLTTTANIASDPSILPPVAMIPGQQEIIETLSIERDKLVVHNDTTSKGIEDENVRNKSGCRKDLVADCGGWIV